MSNQASAPVHPRRVLTVCCVAIVTISFSLVGPAMCMPAMARELRLDYVAQGQVFSAVMWPFAVALVAAGLADRLGFRGLLMLAAGLQVTGWMWLAQARTLPQALAATVLLGIGGSAVDPLLTPLVCAVYPDRRARMANFLHGFYCVGVVATVVLVALLQQAGLSWRWIFRGLGLLCVPYGAMGLLIALPRHTHHGAVRQPTRGLLERPAFWVLGVAMLLAGATELGLANWLPTFVQDLMKSRGPRLAELAAGAGLAAFGGAMAVGRFASSALESRLGVRRLLLASAALCTLCLAAAGLPWGAGYRVACLTLVGLGVACFWPTLLAVAGDRFPQAGATMFSALSAAGTLGCAAAPAAIGWLGQVSGNLTLPMAGLAAAPAGVFLACALLRRSGMAVLEAKELLPRVSADGHG